MRCEAAQVLLERYFDDQLTDGQRKHLEDHLSGCEDCNRQVRSARGYSQLLGSFLSWVQPPNSFRESIYFNVSEASISRRGSQSSESGLHHPAPGGSGVGKFILAGAALIVLVAGAWFGFGMLFGGADAGRVLELRGSVMTRDSGEGGWVPSDQGSDLVWGDEFRLPERSRAKILLPDRSEVELVGGDSGAEATINGTPEKPGLHLMQGEATFVLSSRDEPFLVTTGTASIQAPRNATSAVRFQASLRAAARGKVETLEVRVDKGEVILKNAQGEVRVAAGSVSRTLFGGVPGKAPAPVAPGRKAASNRKAGSNLTGKDAGKQRNRNQSKPLREPRENPPKAPAPTQPDLPQLLARISDNVSADSQQEALGVLLSEIKNGKHEAELDSIVSALLGVIQVSGSVEVRSASVEALAVIDPEKNPEAFEGLLGACRYDASPEVRSRAVSTLARWGKRKEVAQTLASVIRDENEDQVRGEAVKLAKTIQSSELQDALVEQSRDSVRSISSRAECLKSLASYRTAPVVSNLIELAEDYEYEVASAAVASLRILSGRSFSLTQDGPPEERDELFSEIEAWWAEAQESFPVSLSGE